MFRIRPFLQNRKTVGVARDLSRSGRQTRSYSRREGFNLPKGAVPIHLTDERIREWADCPPPEELYTQMKAEALVEKLLNTLFVSQEVIPRGVPRVVIRCGAVYQNTRKLSDEQEKWRKSKAEDKDDPVEYHAAHLTPEFMVKVGKSAPATLDALVPRHRDGLVRLLRSQSGSVLLFPRKYNMADIAVEGAGYPEWLVTYAQTIMGLDKSKTPMDAIIKAKPHIQGALGKFREAHVRALDSVTEKVKKGKGSREVMELLEQWVRTHRVYIPVSLNEPDLKLEYERRLWLLNNPVDPEFKLPKDRARK